VKEMVGNIHKRLRNGYGNASVGVSNVGRGENSEGRGSRNSASFRLSFSSVKGDDRGVLGLLRSDSPCCDAERNGINSDAYISTLKKKEEAFPTHLARQETARSVS
jgi:hypothetical protein